MRSVILEDVGGGMSGVERVLLALRVEGSDRREASDDYTRYGGRRDGGGLRGEGVVAEVAALHAAELDVTVMLQVGVGKPSPEYDEQGEVPDDPGHQHFAGVEDGAADEDDVDYDGHDGAEHRGPDILPGWGVSA